jgi:hypothetical protein
MEVCKSIVGKVGKCIVGIGVGRSNPKSPLIKAGIGASKPAVMQEALAPVGGAGGKGNG